MWNRCIDCGKRVGRVTKRCWDCRKILFRCPNCGKSKGRQSQACWNCSVENKRKITTSKNIKNNFPRKKIVYLTLNHCSCGRKLSNPYATHCKECWWKLNSGKNHFNYIDGSSFEEYGVEFDNVLKEQVRFRDKYKCKVCGCTQLENGRQLNVHHIDYNKKNNIIANLISLCNSCHMKTNYNRKQWTKTLKQLLDECFFTNDK